MLRLTRFIRVDLHNLQEIRWIWQFQGMDYFNLEDEDGDRPCYTRAGNFYMDNTGEYSNAVMGNFCRRGRNLLNPTIPTDAQIMSIGQDGTVTFVDSQTENLRKDM